MESALISDIKQYNRRVFSNDIIAGLTVAIVLIPQGMAYAMLAGLPPIYGLYAALIPMMIYPVFGTSREISIGPVALMSIIVLSGVSLFANPGTQKYLDLILLSALVSGLIQIAFSLLKLGFLSNFLSKPVLNGFIAAAGVIILISQLQYLLSLNLPRRTSVISMLQDIYGHLGELNYLSLILGIAGIILILLLGKIHKSIPAALIVVIIGSVLMYFFRNASHRIPLVGEMPSGLPVFYAGFLDWSYVKTLLPASAVISIICFIGSYAIARSLNDKSNNGTIDANRELLGLGMAKVVGSFFLAMPSTGSFTRSAINYTSGAKTGMASIFGAVMIGFTILFLGPLFYYLPKPVLAAIVITSVFGLLDYKYGKYLYSVDKNDFWVMNITFVATLLLGIVNGVLVGIVLSIITIMAKSSKMRYAVLGRLEGTRDFRNVDRFNGAEPLEDTVILRFSQPLYFASADNFFKGVVREAERYNANNIIVSYPSAIPPDSSATIVLEDLIDYCRLRKWRLIFTDVTGPVRDFLFKTGLYDKIGLENFYLTIDDAARVIEHKIIEVTLSNKYSSQTNYQKSIKQN